MPSCPVQSSGGGTSWREVEELDVDGVTPVAADGFCLSSALVFCDCCLLGTEGVAVLELYHTWHQRACLSV